MKSYLTGRIKLVTGDITQLSVDVIVNAANSSLLGGGGVDGAIHRAAGPILLEECKIIRNNQYPNGLPTGEVVITNAGNLPVTHVIHTVGPIYHAGDKNQKQLLANCYYNSLCIATEKNLNTIAFPAISTGVYGYPKTEAAKIAYTTIFEYLKKYKIPSIVYLVFFIKTDMDIFIKANE